MNRDKIQDRALLSCLSLEIKGLTRRGRSAYAIAKEKHGLRGNRQEVYDQLKAIVDGQRKALTYEDIAKIYSERTGLNARTKPMGAVLRWFEKQPDCEYNELKDEFYLKTLN